MASNRSKESTETLGEDFDLDGDTVSAGDNPEDKDQQQHLEPGSQAGRYTILSQLGRGGMGVVYKAYDPELDRRIALKLLSVTKGSASQADRAQDRLLREAKALAQLSHPNVVSAYDVGTIGDSVYVSMELVEGQTLKEWIQEKKPSIFERVAALCAAGAGIAAAHQAGLIHRDIKPDNIIVGDDGRVRVLDFGLARAALVEDEPSSSSPEPAKPRPGPLLSGDLNSEGSFLSTPMTQAGAIVGTPGYMAPEQYLGKQVDEQSDQYSFCVTLFQVLYGRRPFVARRYGALKQMVLAGKIDEETASARVPSSYRRIALKGLAVNRQERFGSMAELLAELARDPRVRRRRILSVAAILLLVAVSFGGAYALQAGRRQLCQGAPEKLVGLWDQATKAKISAGFAASGRPYAADTFGRVEKIVNVYTDGWVSMRSAACAATHLRGEQSERLLDLRMQCLDRRLSELKALTHLFAAQADATVVDKAVAAVLDLTALKNCADVESLTAAFPLPEDPAVRNRIDSLHSQLDSLKAMEKAGKFKESLKIAQDLQQQAASLPYPPLQAETLFWLGVIQSNLGDAKTAEKTLAHAILAAAKAKDADLLSSVSNMHLFVIGYQLARYDEAIGAGRATEALVTYTGKQKTRMGSLLKNLGIVYWSKGDYPAAQEVLKRATALQIETLGPDHPDVAGILNVSAIIEYEQGKLEQALRTYERARQITARALGAKHPKVGVYFNNIGLVYLKQEKYDLAQQYYQKALTISEQAMGASHPDVAMMLNNLGEFHNSRGQFDLARQYCQRALDNTRDTLQDQHPFLAYFLTCLGRAQVELKHPEQAIEVLQRALAIRKGAASSPNLLAYTQHTLAHALWNAKQDRPRAITLAQAARQIYLLAGEHKRDSLAEVDAWLATHKI